MDPGHRLTIAVQDLGKRYNREWIFRHFTAEWHTGQVIGIEGPNGSGKSTLLRILSGFESPSAGTMQWRETGKPVARDRMYTKVSIAAPYTQLVEELTLKEFIDFHFHFKAYRPGWDAGSVLKRSGLGHSADRTMKTFSSGMKQRVKLLVALLSDALLVMLDEPSTNLDEEGKAWFHDLLKEQLSDRIIFIASNEKDDFRHCGMRLNILDHK